jgi:4-amino-4-deoxy-L-arabinose transferase-like glycosyltransferase
MGETELAARAPSLAAGVGAILLVAWWASRRLGPDAAGPSAAILATTPILFVCARLAITDMLLALWVTAALLLWRESVASSGGARRRLSYGAAGAIGLAALAKGPVGPALAGAVALATWLASRPRGDGAARGLITWRGTALAAAGVALLAGPWVLLLAGRIGVEGILELLRRETIRRSLFGLDHPRPFHYFLATWWVTFFPWSLAAPFIAWKTLRGARPWDPATVFLLCWLGVALLFFSLPADKNDAYLLPAAPAAALLVARWLPRRISLAGSAAMGVLLIAGLLLGAAPLSRDRSLKELASPLAPSLRPETELIAYRLYRPSLVFYADHRARWVASGAELRRLLPAIPTATPVVMVMTEERLERLRADPRVSLEGYRVAGRQPGYVTLSRGE